MSTASPSAAEEIAMRQHAMRILQQRSPANAISPLASNLKTAKFPDGHTLPAHKRAQQAIKQADWVAAVTDEVRTNELQLANLRKAIADVEQVDEELSDAQVQAVLAEEEDAVLREELQELRVRVAKLREQKLKEERQVAGMKAELNVLERLVAVEQRRRAVALGVDHGVAVSKAELRAIFCNHATPDGSGNCLPIENLVDVWQEVWVAHGYEQPMTSDIKRDLVAQFEQQSRKSGVVLWQEFWAQYERIWREIVLPNFKTDEW